MLKPATPQAYKLLHDGCIALSEIESNGMRIDIDYLDKAIEKTKKKIKGIEKKLSSCEEFKLQRRRFGGKTKLTSRDQLATVLFGDMKFSSEAKTATGKPQMNGSALEKIGTDYVRDFIELEKLNKLHGTYLLGVRKEVEGEFLHPFFNLHTVVTYRSSSSNPNFQNIPIRDPSIAETIRKAFIPRDDHVIVEIDISGAEVRVAACYHQDPKMMEYITDKSTDMHRDMARECFLIDHVPNMVRSITKACFVFAEFYGDYYKGVAKNLWEAIKKYNLVNEFKKPMYDHLTDMGITSLGKCNEDHPIPGTFEHHIRQVEDDFWNRRFPVYSQWKSDWYDQYIDSGGFHTLTGFTIEGVFKKNEVINYPVQGSAFHCLLWSLIRLNKAIKKRKMKSLLVGQIHDSIVADVQENELDDFLALAKKTMTIDLPKTWDWIVTPIEIDAEYSPKNWHEKKKIDI